MIANGRAGLEYSQSGSRGLTFNQDTSVAFPEPGRNLERGGGGGAGGCVLMGSLSFSLLGALHLSGSQHPHSLFDSLGLHLFL